jgi:hypothetical protein
MPGAQELAIVAIAPPEVAPKFLVQVFSGMAWQIAGLPSQAGIHPSISPRKDGFT